MFLVVVAVVVAKLGWEDKRLLPLLQLLLQLELQLLMLLLLLSVCHVSRRGWKGN